MRVPCVRTVLSAALLVLIVRGAAAQGQEETVDISFAPDGVSLEDLVSLWSKQTGKTFNYMDSEFRGKPRVSVRGLVRLKKSEIDWFYQSLILTHGFALVPIGPPAADAWRFEFIANSPSLRQSARHVAPSDTAALSRHPAQVFACSFQLQHVSAEQIQRTLSQILVNRNIECVQASSPKSVLVVALGPTLATVGEIVKATDRPENVITPPPEEKDKEKKEGH